MISPVRSGVFEPKWNRFFARVTTIPEAQARNWVAGPWPKLKAVLMGVLGLAILVGILLAAFVVGSIIASLLLALLAVVLIAWVIRYVFRQPQRRL